MKREYFLPRPRKFVFSNSTLGAALRMSSGRQSWDSMTSSRVSAVDHGPSTHADLARSGLSQQMDDGANHVRMRPEGVLHRRVAQALPANADKVDLHRHGLSLHQLLQAAQLIEHLLQCGDQIRAVILAFADGDASGPGFGGSDHRRGLGVWCERRCGKTQRGPQEQITGRRAGSGQPLSSGEVLFHGQSPSIA